MADGAPPVVPIPPFIAKLTGPLLLGHLFNWGLYGCLAVQCYIYYLSFPKDRPLPKSLVIAAITIETLQTILSTRDAFRNFGTGWGDMIDLDAVGWLWFSVPVLGSVITSMAQMFFAWRIYILSKKLYLPILVALISTVQCIFGLWGGIYAHILGRFSEVQSHAYRITSVWLGGTALCDIIIAISMMFYLTRSRTGFRTTNILITKIIRVTVETGFICAAFAILDLAFFLRWQDNNYHLAPSIALSKLYANSLLVVLNARVRIVGGRDSSNGVEQHRSTASSSHLSSNGLQSRPKPPRPSVNMVHMSSYGQESDIPMTDAKPKIQRLEVNIEEEREVYRYPEEEEDREQEYRYQRKSGTLV